MIPTIRVKNRAAKLVEEIPHFIGYMSTLATSGLTLEGIFKAIAKEETDEDIVKDSRFIVRNIEIKYRRITNPYIIILWEYNTYV